MPETVPAGAVMTATVGGVTSPLGAPAALNVATCITQKAEPLSGAVAL